MSTKNNGEIEQGTRHYGIDLLRVIAMLMVCLIHLNLIMKTHTRQIEGRELTYFVGVWTEAVGLIGVNLYALITGYVCVLGKWRFSRYMRLWVLVAFYTIVIGVAGVLLAQYGIIPWNSTWKTIWNLSVSLFYGSSYWYFAAYTGLFFVSPFINRALQKSDKQTLQYLLVVIGFLLVLMNHRAGSVLYSYGYNMTWLLVLYIIGAYVRLFPPKQPRLRYLFFVALLCTVQPLVSKLTGLPHADIYTWPVAVAYSVALFLIFTRIQISSVPLRRFIEWAASASFAVYLIHSHPWVWDLLSRYMNAWNTSLNYPCWLSLVGAGLLYLLCACADHARAVLFRLCRIEGLSDCFARTIENIASRLLHITKKF